MTDDLTTKITRLLHEAAPNPKAAPAAINQTAHGSHNLQIVGDLRISPRIIIQPGPQHLSEAQAYKIHQLIKALVKYQCQAGADPRTAFATWYRRLKQRYRCTSYKTIPADQADAAINWLTAQLVRLRRQSSPNT